ANALRDGTLEAAVGPPPAPALTRGITSEALTREELCVVARPEHPLARAARLQWRDLDRASWILQPVGSALRQSMDTLFARKRIRPGDSLVETVSIVATLALLPEMDALSVLPVDLARHYERNRMLVRLRLPAAGATDYVLMLRADRELSPPALAFARRSAASPASGRSDPNADPLSM